MLPSINIVHIILINRPGSDRNFLLDFASLSGFQKAMLLSSEFLNASKFRFFNRTKSIVTYVEESINIS